MQAVPVDLVALVQSGIEGDDDDGGDVLGQQLAHLVQAFGGGFGGLGDQRDGAGELVGVAGLAQGVDGHEGAAGGVLLVRDGHDDGVGHVHGCLPGGGGGGVAGVHDGQVVVLAQDGVHLTEGVGVDDLAVACVVL